MLTQSTRGRGGEARAASEDASAGNLAIPQPRLPSICQTCIFLSLPGRIFSPIHPVGVLRLHVTVDRKLEVPKWEHLQGVMVLAAELIKQT